METLASKTMLKRVLVIFQDKFYFRWLENSVIEIGKAATIVLMSNHLNWNPSKRFAGDSIGIDLNNTYSEAMLISGASKQISCAIFYIFDLLIY